jgi:hypothetical protein
MDPETIAMGSPWAVCGRTGRVSGRYMGVRGQ